MGNTPEFESGVLSSNLSLVSKDVGFSLFGKVPHCECGEYPDGYRGGVNPGMRIRAGVMVTHSSPFLSERQIVDDCIQFDSEGRTRMAYSLTDQNTALRTQRYKFESC